MFEPSIELELQDLDATHRFARLLAVSVVPPMVIALEGTLGAGKTAWTRAFAAAVGVDPQQVTSPTFVLIHRYDLESTTPTDKREGLGDQREVECESEAKCLYHIDAYRVRDLDEFLELGVEEIFESSSITILEWGSKVRETLPVDRIDIQIEIESENSRRVMIAGGGKRSKEAIEAFRQLWLVPS